MKKVCSVASNSKKNGQKKQDLEFSEWKQAKMGHAPYKDLFYEFDHTFILRKLHKFCHIDDVTAQFLPIRDSLHHVGKKTYAVFNNDRKYFTPAFVIGRDIKQYDQTPQFDRQKFKEKVKTIADNCKAPQGQIFIPKPSKTTCQVCQKQFEDYLAHIGLKEHKKALRDSEGSNYINDLVSKYEKSKGQIKKANKISKNRNSGKTICRNIKLCKQNSNSENDKKTRKARKKNQLLSISTHSEHDQIIL